MQHVLLSCCRTENIDSKMLIMLDEWNHISSQHKSVLIATFKAFYVRRSFAKCMQMPDDKNNFTVKEFFNLSISNLSQNIMAEAWAQISQSYNNGFWKKLCCHFIQDFQCSEWAEEVKKLKEQFSVLAEKCSFDEPEEVDIVQFWQQKKAVKWRINAHTRRVCACYLGFREKLLNWRITGIRLDSDILRWSHYKSIGNFNEV